MLHKKLTLASSQHYQMTLKTKTALPLNNKKRNTKINIGVKSTLSTDFENNNINASTRDAAQQYQLSKSTSTCVCSELFPFSGAILHLFPQHVETKGALDERKKTTSRYVASLVKT